MIRRRPTEGEATPPAVLQNTAPSGSQLSSLIDRYNSSIDPVERISLFRNIGTESEKAEYSAQIDAQSPSEVLPQGAEKQAGSQSPDETLPPGVNEQINAQGPSETEAPMEEPHPKNTPKTQEELDKIEMR
eukprot:5121492-Pleurochrysis_carterae.AAC.1